MYKKVTACLTALLLAGLLLTGCGSAEDITPEEFRSMAEDYNFTVVDMTGDFEGEVETALIAYNEEDSAQVEYYRVHTHSQVLDAFEKNKAALQNGKVEKERGNRWAGVLDGDYQVISAADHTFIYASCRDEAEDEKKVLRSFLKKIRY